MMSSFSVGINIQFGLPFIPERCENEISYAIIKKWVSQFCWEPRWTRSRSSVAKVNSLSWVNDRDRKPRSGSWVRQLCFAEPVKFYIAWIACTWKYFYSLWYIPLRIILKLVLLFLILSAIEFTGHLVQFENPSQIQIIYIHLSQRIIIF